MACAKAVRPRNLMARSMGVVMPEEYTACVLMSNKLCTTGEREPITLQGMGSKNIEWAVIEAKLTAMDKDQAWFTKSMGVGNNVVTNWKARGIPRGRAPELARLLGMTTDELFGVEEHRHALQPAEYLANELSRLVAAYVKADSANRRSIMAAVSVAEESAAIADKSKSRR